VAISSRRRLGELQGLRWEDVDLVSHRLTVQNPNATQDTKNHTRTVPIDPMLYGLLFEAYHNGDGGELVCDGVGGDIHRAVKRICQRGGVKPYAKPCHTLRKNCETDWSEKYPIQAVTEWLGNSVEVAMKHYVRAEDSLFEKAAGITEAEECSEKRSQSASVES